MESIFDKDPNDRPPPSVYDRIGPEIEHLKKGSSTRHGKGPKKHRGVWSGVLLLLIIVGLFFLDPFLFGWYKSAAIPVYQYLHNYDSATATDALVASGIFSRDELETLSKDHTAGQGEFASPRQAEEKAAEIVSYMNGVKALHQGKYEELSYLNKLRYIMFIKLGLTPPKTWNQLSPSIH